MDDVLPLQGSSALREWIGVAWRFGLSGAINSVVGLGVIALLDLGLHVAPALANAAGFVLCIPLAYVLTRGFVFKHRSKASDTGPRYLLVVACAFGLNQGVLYLVGRQLGPGAAPHLAAQLAGMVSYTVTTFFACRLWVFRDPAPPRPLAA